MYRKIRCDKYTRGPDEKANRLNKARAQWIGGEDEQEREATRLRDGGVGVM